MCKKMMLLMILVLVVGLTASTFAETRMGQITVNEGDNVVFNERVNMDGGDYVIMNGGALTVNGELKFPDSSGDQNVHIYMHGGFFHSNNTESMKDRGSHLHIGAGTFETCSIGDCSRTPNCAGAWDVDLIDDCTELVYTDMGNGCMQVTAVCGPPDCDGDGIPDDGDNSGIVGDAPCTGGETADCDDNCMCDANADQADADGDELGDVCDVCEGYDDSVDTDADTVPDGCDNCPENANTDQADMDEDGVGDVCDDDVDGDGCEVDPGADDCPLDPNKCEEGVCGCGVADTDTDGDLTPDCIDGCPDDPDKTEPGDCGCGVPDTDLDEDGIACGDNCPDDYNPVADCDSDPQTPDVQCDADNDGCGDECDDCDEDPGKCEAGECGCGVAETGDTDGDGVHDCNEDCPNDPDKSEPGICGCGVADESPNTDDDDDDGVANCNDACPGEDDNDDADEDGVPDACDNCPCTANPDQAESADPGCGDACYDPGINAALADAYAYYDFTTTCQTDLSANGRNAGLQNGASCDGNGVQVNGGAFITIPGLCGQNFTLYMEMSATWSNNGVWLGEGNGGQGGTLQWRSGGNADGWYCAGGNGPNVEGRAKLAVYSEGSTTLRGYDENGNEYGSGGLNCGPNCGDVRLGNGWGDAMNDLGWPSANGQIARLGVWTRQLTQAEIQSLAQGGFGGGAGGCTDDADDDGLEDCLDNCPDNANEDQTNSDNDSHGDACDNCTTTDNEDQANSDGDTLGDACDNCPNDDNEDQANADGDSCGDACDQCPDNASTCVEPCGCPTCLGDMDGDGWKAANDVSTLVSQLLPYASLYYWVQVTDPADCGDMDQDGWKAANDVSTLVSQLLPYASLYYWVQCP